MNDKVRLNISSTSFEVSSSSTSTSGVTRTHDINVRNPGLPRDIENAVYAYIQAVRTLGRTTINTEDIARALSVASADVEKVVGNLRDKGVRRVA